MTRVATVRDFHMSARAPASKVRPSPIKGLRHDGCEHRLLHLPPLRLLPLRLLPRPLLPRPLRLLAVVERLLRAEHARCGAAASNAVPPQLDTVAVAAVDE